jgi:hypothetical protein
MTDFFTWQVGVFTIAVFVFTLFVRRIVETVFPTLSRKTEVSTAQNYWEKIGLLFLPVVVGILMAVLVKSWPWPAAITKAGSRAIVGAVCGFFSTWGYRVVKTILTDRFKVNLEAPVTLPTIVPGKEPPPPPVP